MLKIRCFQRSRGSEFEIIFSFDTNHGVFSWAFPRPMLPEFRHLCHLNIIMSLKLNYSYGPGYRPCLFVTLRMSRKLLYSMQYPGKKIYSYFLIIKIHRYNIAMQKSSVVTRGHSGSFVFTGGHSGVLFRQDHALSATLRFDFADQHWLTSPIQ